MDLSGPGIDVKLKEKKERKDLFKKEKIANIWHNLFLQKITVSTYAKGKFGSNSPEFKQNINPNVKFYMISSSR